MQVEFHGAAGEVTGSMHLVEAAGRRILLDCGMLQGRRELEAQNAAPFPFDPAALDALVLSHAHIDHIGRVPLLVARGFRGPVFLQRATADLLPVMLEDAASLAESEAARANRHRDPEQPPQQPLFTAADVARVMKLLRPLPYDTRTTIAPGVEIALRDAGHILGSSIVELWADGRKLVFSGDIGPKGTPILRDPVAIAEADLVLMESTYGDRNHRDRQATVAELGEVFDHAWRERGNVLIPAFAVGRSQELLYWFARHWKEWNLQRWRVFLDSPMAGRVVEVYDRHHDLFDQQAQAVWRQHPSPFRLPNLHITASTQESMAINSIASGAIVIAGSGMANGGRLLPHPRHRGGRRDPPVVFVGYQAEGTLGRRLVERAPWVRIHGSDYRVNAQIHTVGGLSAHTDQQGLIEWYGNFRGAPPLALVHGEDRAREALAGEIGQRSGARVILARPGMRLQV
ncbi:MBL fold metallo-hydrolase RNA specificity domain-containing protein [Pseudoxanthomonas koreensis]|uniref:MBL fold metallo-hydrolase RNA specificity domain-containing protein n=1 Tax=Pseudoxanthomonas koreensis TaxID=266061 RepID=UPI0013907AAD|nr:MBL fold metallo-hydrolase [Pseudoxanthomonas koreensis]KAF1692710.1 MBL fold metallo-hydrolase [Pseudoxanthomonas koreensis]